MWNFSNIKNNNLSKNGFKKFYLNSNCNNFVNLSRNYKLEKPVIYKKRNLSLTKNNLSIYSSKEKKISFNSKLFLTNQHSFNHSLLKKRNLRNKKIRYYSPNQNSINNTNQKTKKYKNSPETNSTANSSKRTNPKSNLTSINLKISINFNKIRNKIINQFNSLRTTTLHFQKKKTLEEEGYIITEESNLNNENNKSKKHLKNISQNSFDDLDLSFTYSDDTESKRYQLSKRRMFGDKNDNEKLYEQNIDVNNNIYYGVSMNYQMKNSNDNYFTNYNNINRKSRNVKEKDDFTTFCEEIQRKLFGE